jgi:hypothetical protein
MSATAKPASRPALLMVMTGGVLGIDAARLALSIGRDGCGELVCQTGGDRGIGRRYGVRYRAAGGEGQPAGAPDGSLAVACTVLTSTSLERPALLLEKLVGDEGAEVVGFCLLASLKTLLTVSGFCRPEGIREFAEVPPGDQRYRKYHFAPEPIVDADLDVEFGGTACRQEMVGLRQDVSSEKDTSRQDSFLGAPAVRGLPK